MQHHLPARGLAAWSRCRWWCRGPATAGGGPSPRALRSGARPTRRPSRGRRAGRRRPRGRCRGPGRRRGRPRPRPTTVPSKDTWWVCTCACRPSAAASRRRRRLVRHVPDDRLLDQPVHPGGPDPVREPRDLVVDEPRRREAQGDGGAGDPPGPPRRQVPGLDAGPGAREPVPQLERLTEVGLAGLGGQPDRGRELGHAELRDQRGAGPATGTGVSPNRTASTDRLRRVQVRPGAGRVEQVDLGGVGDGAAVPGEREHPGSGVRCSVEVGCRRGHGSILVEHVFERKCEIRRASSREPRRSEGGRGRSGKLLRALLNHRPRSSSTANVATGADREHRRTYPRRCAFNPRPAATARSRSRWRSLALPALHPRTPPSRRTRAFDENVVRSRDGSHSPSLRSGVCLPSSI